MNTLALTEIVRHIGAHLDAGTWALDGVGILAAPLDIRVRLQASGLSIEVQMAFFAMLAPDLAEHVRQSLDQGYAYLQRCIAERLAEVIT
jgi:hypothetical protein